MLSVFFERIVDTEKNTRTSIHVPINEELTVSEIPNTLLQNVDLLYCDGRHAEVACRVLEMIQELNDKQIPCVLDAEKLRGHNFDKLLREATYIITNKQFPIQFLLQKQSTTTTTDLLSGLTSILKNGIAKFVVTTLGSQGSILLTRYEHISTLSNSFTISTKNIKTFSELESEVILSKQNRISKSNYTTQNAISFFHFLDPHCTSSDPFIGLHCSAYPLSSSEIVNTTGAGDSFIATVCYCLLHNYSIEKMLLLASFVAAMKCRESGGSLTGIVDFNSIPINLMC
jgi:sugar/nucleoside kinase (ribokinase family)